MSHNDAATDVASIDETGDEAGRFDATTVGPTVDLGDVPLPPSVGHRLQTLYGTDDPPRDAGAWIDATREGIEAVRGRAPTVEDLCTAADGDHRFVPDDGDAQAYVCVLDPLAYPFITDTPGTVRSATQVREETVSVEVTDDGVAVSHPDAVVSIGVADHVEYVEDVTPAVVYRQICGYIHVFADEREYETWAADVEAATTAVPVETGIGIAKALAGVLFE